MMVLAYDGTDFHGWQRQPELRTVQGELEGVVRRVVREEIQVIGSGRTDAGVHAAGQVANFVTGSTVPVDSLMRAIGSRLAEDMAMVRLSEVPLTFHATQSAVSKLYRYRIYASTSRPVENLAQRYTYHFWRELDLAAVREAAGHFVGRQDFAAMASKGSERETTVRTVFRCDARRQGREVWIDVEGGGFLYNQVRNMVGTLLEVGRGHWPPQRVAEILVGRDRQSAGPTAPARGLCLQWVRYDQADTGLCAVD
jgi:tRNA pseudouridine38-40 synthase